jgi:hypothetical protein
MAKKTSTAKKASTATKRKVTIAQKATTTAKKPATTVKKSTGKVAAKAAAKKKIAKGDSYVCGVCGLAVTVERVGNIAYYEESPILCCSKPMKAKKPNAKIKAKLAK